MLLAEVISWLLALKLAYLKKFYFTHGETGHVGRWEFFEGPTASPRQWWDKPRLRGCGDFILLRNALVKFSREAEVMGERLLLKLAGVILKPWLVFCKLQDWGVSPESKGLKTRGARKENLLCCDFLWVKALLPGGRREQGLKDSGINKTHSPRKLRFTRLTKPLPKVI